MLDDGQILRTRISHPPNRDTYGPSLWGHILRDQLDVSEAEFWRCVRDRVTPERGGRAEDATSPIPAGVIAQLLAHGMPESEVKALSRAEAIEMLNDIWSAGGGG
ncbi:MAG: hypothetical protein Q4F67_07325 [Propionibacteriaceae bacterium]|nr:hypothetical protein [Propionibacteriaceae bacterium]